MAVPSEIVFYRRYIRNDSNTTWSDARISIVRQVQTRPVRLQRKITQYSVNHPGTMLTPFDIMIKDVLYLSQKANEAVESAGRRQDMNPRECMSLRNYLIMLLEGEKQGFLQDNYSSMTQLAKATCWLSVAMALSSIPFRSQVFAGLEAPVNHEPVSNRTVARLTVGNDNTYQLLLNGDKTGLGGESPILVPLGEQLSGYVYHYSQTTWLNQVQRTYRPVTFFFPWRSLALRHLAPGPDSRDPLEQKAPLPSSEAPTSVVSSSLLVLYLQKLLGPKLGRYVPGFHDLRFLCINTFGRHCRFAKDQLRLAGILTRDTVKVIQAEYAYWHRLESQMSSMTETFLMQSLLRNPGPRVLPPPVAPPPLLAASPLPLQAFEERPDLTRCLGLHSRIPPCICGSGRRIESLWAVQGTALVLGVAGCAYHLQRNCPQQDVTVDVLIDVMDESFARVRTFFRNTANNNRKERPQAPFSRKTTARQDKQCTLLFGDPDYIRRNRIPLDQIVQIDQNHSYRLRWSSGDLRPVITVHVGPGTTLIQTKSVRDVWKSILTNLRNPANSGNQIPADIKKDFKYWIRSDGVLPIDHLASVFDTVITEEEDFRRNYRVVLPLDQTFFLDGRRIRFLWTKETRYPTFTEVDQQKGIHFKDISPTGTSTEDMLRLSKDTRIHYREMLCTRVPSRGSSLRNMTLWFEEHIWGPGSKDNLPAGIDQHARMRCYLEAVAPRNAHQMFTSSTLGKKVYKIYSEEDAWAIRVTWSIGTAFPTLSFTRCTDYKRLPCSYCGRPHRTKKCNRRVPIDLLGDTEALDQLRSHQLSRDTVVHQNVVPIEEWFSTNIFKLEARGQLLGADYPGNTEMISAYLQAVKDRGNDPPRDDYRGTYLGVDASRNCTSVCILRDTGDGIPTIIYHYLMVQNKVKVIPSTRLLRDLKITATSHVVPKAPTAQKVSKWILGLARTLPSWPTIVGVEGEVESNRNYDSRQSMFVKDIIYYLREMFQQHSVTVEKVHAHSARRGIAWMDLRLEHGPMSRTSDWTKPDAVRLFELIFQISTSKYITLGNPRPNTKAKPKARNRARARARDSDGDDADTGDEEAAEDETEDEDTEGEDDPLHVPDDNDDNEEDVPPPRGGGKKNPVEDIIDSFIVASFVHKTGKYKPSKQRNRLLDVDDIRYYGYLHLRLKHSTAVKSLATLRSLVYGTSSLPLLRLSTFTSSDKVFDYISLLVRTQEDMHRAYNRGLKDKPAAILPNDGDGEQKTIVAVTLSSYVTSIIRYATYLGVNMPLVARTQSQLSSISRHVEQSTITANLLVPDYYIGIQNIVHSVLKSVQTCVEEFLHRTMTSPGLEMFYIYQNFPPMQRYTGKEFVDEVVQPYLLLCLMFFDTPMSTRNMLNLRVPNIHLGTNLQQEDRWYEDHELCTELKSMPTKTRILLPHVTFPTLYLSKNAGYYMVTPEKSGISSQTRQRGHKTRLRNSMRPVDPLVGHYLFLLGIYQSHAHPRPKESLTVKNDHYLFSGRKGGLLTPAVTMKKLTTFFVTFGQTQEWVAIQQALSNHRSLLGLAEKCHLVRNVQLSRDPNNNMDIKSLFMAGNAIKLGYITADSITPYYQATQNLIDLRRANEAWFPHLGTTNRVGRIPGCPTITNLTMGNTVQGLRFHPFLSPTGDPVHLPGGGMNMSLSQYSKPLSRARN